MKKQVRAVTLSIGLLRCMQHTRKVKLDALFFSVLSVKCAMIKAIKVHLYPETVMKILVVEDERLPTGSRNTLLERKGVSVGRPYSHVHRPFGAGGSHSGLQRRGGRSFRNWHRLDFSAYGAEQTSVHMGPLVRHRSADRVYEATCNGRQKGRNLFRHKTAGAMLSF